ncbi:S1 RNA-binding domain-containing protein [Streptococcus pneumoniae]|nr:S1 RNA-binding domain-containing protein [Streptococcus pneumoniae]CJB14753.1 S1 RNA-binding domain-containing protein [Streptococcus pneumoniae]CJD48589.1 S1 RNA-binding domain-containing protein [Streptococcus pneumoniae]CJG79726.1 S1 RNA-binding domain-containing protein [Streptococcus pneumoniae]CJJ28971.1 S1 RNA-binding domain-containing protein [Streptococcus pneumoniae]
MILFENLFKPGQLHLAVGCFELTSSVLSTTSKQCFEQPVTSFLSDALVLIAYNQKEKFSPEKHIE